MAIDGSLRFDTAINTKGFLTGLTKLSSLAKQGATALAKLSMDGLTTSAEVAYTAVSKVANIGFSALTSSLDLATQGISAVASATTDLISKSVEVGESFESAMSQVLATAGLTKDSVAEINGETVNVYDALSDKARELGASTQFSASEVASAFNYMALAGWDAEEQLNAIDGVLDLAAASGMELGETCDIVTDYLSAFGMASSEVGTMADMMAYAQSNANLTVSNLAESWKNCAANMNANGQSIETTTALLSKMADQGYKGSEAGTALSAIVRDMSNAMEDGAIKIGDTAVSVADSKGNYRDLTDVLADVEKAVGNLSETERTTALSTTFTADSIKGMNLLLNAGADSVQEFAENLEDMSVIEGYASKAAATLNDNLEGDLKSLSSASEGVYEAIYRTLSPSLRELAQNGTKYLQEFNESLNKDGIAGIIAFASSFGDVLVEAIDDNSQLLQNVTTYGTTIVTSLIDGIRKHIGEIADFLSKNIAQGLTAGESVFTDFYNLGFKLVSAIGEGLSENPQMFTSLVEDFVKSISSTFTRYSSKLAKSSTTILKAILKGISNSIGSASKDVTVLIGDLAKIFVEEAPEFITIGTDIVTSLIQGIEDGMKSTDVSTDDIVNALATGLEQNSERLLESAWKIISAIGRGIGENLPLVGQYALNIVVALSDFLGEHADEVGDGAVELITSLADTLVTEDNLSKILAVALKIITAFANGLTSQDNLTKIMATAKNVITAVADTLLGETEGGSSGINDVVSAGANVGGQLIAGFAKALFDTDTGIYAILTELIKSVGEYLADNFWNLGSMAIEGFISGVSGTDFSFDDWFDSMSEQMKNGTFWSETFSETGSLWTGVAGKVGGFDTVSRVTDDELENYLRTNMGYSEETIKALQDAVSSNSNVSTQLDTATTTFAEALGAFNTAMENRQTTVSMYLYPNSEAFDTAILDSQNRLVATSGGHTNGN